MLMTRLTPGMARTRSFENAMSRNARDFQVAVGCLLEFLLRPRTPVSPPGLRLSDRQKYIPDMKVKTSVTLSEDIIKDLDRAARRGESRSRAIERLLRERLAAEARRAADRKDLDLINEHSAELNAEAEDVLSYQKEL